MRKKETILRYRQTVKLLKCAKNDDFEKRNAEEK